MEDLIKAGSSAGASKDPIAEAGCILIRLGIMVLQSGSAAGLSADLVARELRHVRNLLSNANPRDDIHIYSAARIALEQIEALERGDTLLPLRDVFDSHVEAVHGGSGAQKLGGRRISNKVTARNAYLRAAMCALWELNKEARNQLVKDAVGLGIIGKKTDSHAKNYSAVEARIANVQKRPDDGAGPTAPEYVHLDIVRELVQSPDYRRLADFLPE